MYTCKYVLHHKVKDQGVPQGAGQVPGPETGHHVHQAGDHLHATRAGAFWMSVQKLQGGGGGVFHRYLSVHRDDDYGLGHVPRQAAHPWRSIGAQRAQCALQIPASLVGLAVDE